ncbi:MAG: hypothetical protein ACRCXZ_04725 [Patescibacteria group bacterium]
MIKFISFLGVTLAILITFSINIVSLAGSEIISDENLKPKCFMNMNNKFNFPFFLNKDQKDLMARIKMNELAIKKLKIAFSLENRIISCLKRNRSINGFEKLVIPTFAAFPNLTQYSVYSAEFSTYGAESHKLTQTAQIDISYDPKTGYQATTSLTDPIIIEGRLKN